jgi:hypothetical protein
MSDTPETDHLEVPLAQAAMHSHPILWEHSRRMERERDEARKDLEFRRDLYKVQEGYLEETREKSERYRLEANSFMLQRDEARNELLKCNEYNDELYRKLKQK